MREREETRVYARVCVCLGLDERVSKKQKKRATGWMQKTVRPRNKEKLRRLNRLARITEGVDGTYV